MLGFEVLGAVLGSIPLVISGLEHYRDGIRTIQRWRKYDRELQSLIRNLETENIRLQNLCEKLLDGLVLPSQIDAMVECPLGDLWQDQAMLDKIAARLWRSWGIFEGTVKNVHRAVAEMRDILHQQEKDRSSETSSLVRQLKNMRFTLNRPTFADLLTTIREGVSNLETLTVLNIELEPQRRKRSQARFIGIVRQLSSSVYRAIRASLECSCNHLVSWRLSKWAADIKPDDDREKAIQRLKFHLALAYNFEGSMVSDASETEVSWREIFLQARPPTPIFDTSCNWDLCGKLKHQPSAKSLECLGTIVDHLVSRKRAYAVYPIQELHPESHHSKTLVSLNDILSGRKILHPPTYTQRLRLAVLVSSSFIQLHKTPWLQGLPSSTSIYFIQRGQYCFYDEAFTLDGHAPTENSLPIIRSPTLLALGILLIEIMRVQTIESLQAPEEAFGNGPNLFSKYMTGRRLSSEIYQTSPNYSSAVRRCIEAEFQSQNLDLEDENFRQEMYSGVVALLEQDLKQMESC